MTDKLPGGERILLVDDEEVLRRLANAILSRRGYDVTEADGPLAAIAIASAPFVAVITR